MLHSIWDIAASAAAKIGKAPGTANIPQQLTTYLRVNAGRVANEGAPLVRLTTCPAALASLLSNLDLLDRLPLSHACHALLTAVPPGPHIICRMFSSSGSLDQIQMPSGGLQHLGVPIWCPGLWGSLSALLARVPAGRGVALRIESDLSDDLLEVLSTWLHKLSSLELIPYQVHIRPRLARHRRRTRAIARIFDGVAADSILRTQPAPSWAYDPLFQRFLRLLQQKAPTMQTLFLEVPAAEDGQDVFIPANLLGGVTSLRRLHLVGVCIPPNCPQPLFSQLIAFDYSLNGDMFGLDSMQEILDLIPSLVTLGLSVPCPNAPASGVPSHSHAKHACLRHVGLNLARMVYHPNVHESLRVLCDLIEFFQRSAAADLDFALEVPRYHPQYNLAPDPRFCYPRVDQGFLWADLWASADGNRLQPPKFSMLSHCLRNAPFVFSQLTELSISISDLVFGEYLHPGPPPTAPQMERLTLLVDICSNCPGPFVSYSDVDSVWAYANWRHPSGYLRRWECPALRDVVLSWPGRAEAKRPGLCDGDCLLGISGLDVFLRAYLALSPAANATPLRSLTLPARRVRDHDMPIARLLAHEVILVDDSEGDVAPSQCGPIRPLPQWEHSDNRWYSAPSNVFRTAEPMPYIDTWDGRMDGDTMGLYTRHVGARRHQDDT